MGVSLRRTKGGRHFLHSDEMITRVLVVLLRQDRPKELSPAGCIGWSLTGEGMIWVVYRCSCNDRQVMLSCGCYFWSQQFHRTSSTLAASQQATFLPVLCAAWEVLSPLQVLATFLPCGTAGKVHTAREWALLVRGCTLLLLCNSAPRGCR